MKIPPLNTCIGIKRSNPNGILFTFMGVVDSFCRAANLLKFTSRTTGLNFDYCSILCNQIKGNCVADDVAKHLSDWFFVFIFTSIYQMQFLLITCLLWYIKLNYRRVIVQRVWHFNGRHGSVVVRNALYKWQPNLTNPSPQNETLWVALSWSWHR